MATITGRAFNRHSVEFKEANSSNHSLLFIYLSVITGQYCSIWLLNNLYSLGSMRKYIWVSLKADWLCDCILCWISFMFCTKCHYSFPAAACWQLFIGWCKMWNHSKHYRGHGVTKPEFKCSVFTFHWLTRKYHIAYHIYVWLFLKSLRRGIGFITTSGVEVAKINLTINAHNNCNSLALRHIASSTQEIALVGNYFIRPLLWQASTAFCHKHSDLLLFHIRHVNPAFHNVCWGVENLILVHTKEIQT